MEDDVGDDRSYLAIGPSLSFFVSMAVIGSLAGLVISAVAVSGKDAAEPH
jgi:hypothetical protein